MRIVCKKTSAGLDGIPCHILKGNETSLLYPLTLLINASFEQGKFPTNLKSAKIIPIFKKGDRRKVENYRPIAILSVFSKIFEKAFATKILDFLNKFSLINEIQHGFTRSKSTTTATVAYMLNVLKALKSAPFED